MCHIYSFYQQHTLGSMPKGHKLYIKMHHHVVSEGNFQLEK